MNEGEVLTPDAAPDGHAEGNGTSRTRNGQRRDQILDAALQLFAQNGMANVTTRQIAQAVGISQPSLYAHFRTADEIGGELCARAFATLSARMQRCADLPGTPRERLARMARAYVEFGLDNPDMYRVAFMIEDMKTCAEGAAPTDADTGPTDPVLAAGLRSFAVMHEQVIALLGRDCEEAMLTAQLIWVHVHGLVSLLIARPEFPWLDRERLIAAHIACLPLQLRQ